jgi:uncharacterized SAM-binding protein YcdF (DUF218 family)
MFVIGKIFGWLLHPFYWIVFLILLALFRRDAFLRRRWLIVAGVMVLFFTNPWIITRLFLAWQPARQELAVHETYEAGILLGGYAGWDEKGRAAYFNGSSDRFLETVRLYESGHIRKIVLTGAAGQLTATDFVEADFARSTLLEMGVPDTDILVERRSRNTFENADFTKILLDSLGMKGKQVLITSAMHMPRAELIFRKTGIDVRPYPCAYMVVPQDGSFGLESLLPGAHCFDMWDVYLRERAGHLVASLRN